MKEFVLIVGGVYGALAVIFGAFGAHGLKKILNAEQLKSFETGVKYQMYHALLLILVGVIFPFSGFSQNLMGWFLILGVFFFSFSIYGLVISAARGRKMAFLGPVTPLGGLLLVMGWILFTVNISAIAENIRF
ncbi:Uncharacterized membrane protein YgdD, TMEM256/DUF423 family [Salinimicrobium catena]|uniref:Uncharacterized membrane protein YgdD, TMEM256/DUF423 family n=1 Tax=Salinimicrobium catena TaxID=390640 RepID=A0A1H5P5F3_9FLAO|nr:DUF423 domain-containing protein [Salinimicrobium catena]SDL67648.1 Uncharacterized membrane protein YgdD, TMEM256/DUF423 family [Salinimicrobium catena]SEF08281.1 Uncharacterized membrane protein YgdD, TMEM256/DUF423 family [Salinimicrobium catena]